MVKYTFLKLFGISEPACPRVRQWSVFLFVPMHKQPHKHNLLTNCFQTSGPHDSCMCFRNAARLRGVDVVVLGPVSGAVLSGRTAPSHPLYPAETRQQWHAVPRAGGTRGVHAAQLPRISVMPVTLLA